MTEALVLDGRLFGEGQPCFGCSPTHPHGFRLAFAREGDDVVARLVPGPLHQGPVGVMHGGLVSTLADEGAAWAVIAATGKFGFTTSFSARLHHPVRVGVEAEVRARVTSRSSRVVKATAVIRQHTRDCFAGDFVFALLDKAAAEQVMGGPVPPAWERFCR
ncbi:MAG: PaaI family thioesterase [Myxococcaceae bacterium]|jgi:acyl-coenzyme A thioesterase PaaI-like protein|nr:PaaI family thioesterase [Myxococcaceae bacterium]MCA3010818.1 PaaI family thioesterase [Myxococcaceae bacterium]